jgi:hypothetical protein
MKSRFVDICINSIDNSEEAKSLLNDALKCRSILILFGSIDKGEIKSLDPLIDESDSSDDPQYMWNSIEILIDGLRSNISKLERLEVEAKKYLSR